MHLRARCIFLVGKVPEMEKLIIGFLPIFPAEVIDRNGSKSHLTETRVIKSPSFLMLTRLYLNNLKQHIELWNGLKITNLVHPGHKIQYARKSCLCSQIAKVTKCLNKENQNECAFVCWLESRVLIYVNVI